MTQNAGPRAEVTSQELVERALEMSKVDASIVLADETTAANLRWANNTLTSNGVTRGRQLTVISIAGGATGIVSREGVTLDNLEELVRAAENAAASALQSGVKAEDRMPLAVPGGAPVGPAGPAGPAGARPPVGPAGEWHAPAGETSIAVFRDFSPALGDAFGRAEGNDERLFGYASHQLTTTFTGSSTGLRARHDQPTGYVEINGKSPDFKRSAWVGVPTEDFGDVDVAALTAELSKRIGWASKRIEIPAGRYPTILPPSAVADLMIYTYWSAGALDAHDGRTVFSRPGGGTRVGDRLTASPVTLRSDPNATSLKCSPFVVAHNSSASLSVFDNGLPLSPTNWISEGTLQALVQTRHSSEVTGLPATPYVDNLIMDGGDSGVGLEDMVGASQERTLLLTCLWYIREVDPQTLLLTGLTRDGVYLVEGGEVVGAVDNFRFNESPVDLLGRITRVGRSERTLPREWSDYFTRTAMPALRVEDFNMSSVSQAS